MGIVKNNASVSHEMKTGTMERRNGWSETWRRNKHGKVGTVCVLGEGRQVCEFGEVEKLEQLEYSSIVRA